MDPNVTLCELLRAFADGDAGTAVERSADLHTWISNGGLLPSVTDDDCATVGFERFSIDLMGSR